jgi:hypothetical protein
MLNLFETYTDAVVLDQKVFVIVNRYTKGYYNGIGYNVKVNDELYVTPSDLALGSHEKLWTQCPRCCLLKQSICKNVHRYKSTYCAGCKTTWESSFLFADKAILVHGDKYDYSNVEYENGKVKVEIICKQHGSFYQRPNDHFSGYGCLKCSPTSQKTLENFIKESRLVHGNQYDYSKVKYKNLITKVIIICPKHGEFIQDPAAHIHHKTGCPDCNMSKGEVAVYVFLTNNKIKFETQWTNHSAVGKGRCKLKFDFYLPDYECCIEFDGQGHYFPIDYFGGEKAFKQTQRRDQIKNQWAADNNYHLIRIPYWEFDNIEAILTKELNL